MYIGHRCDCGHTDLQHQQDGTFTSLGGCTSMCNRPCGPLAAPEVIPTFDGKGRVVERVIAPGGGLPSMGGGVTVKVCPCEACVAVYERVTAPQAA
jgi:hypothetical protein